ncbi:MAG: hypothetical protein ACK5Q5_21700 [Planctomycetaceae bacterium]
MYSIAKESVIAFDYADVYPTEDVQQGIDSGMFDLKEDASEELMLLIWDGAFKTRRMTLRCRQLLEQTVFG